MAKYHMLFQGIQLTIVLYKLLVSCVTCNIGVIKYQDTPYDGSHLVDQVH